MCVSEWEWVLREWVLNKKKRGKRLREIWSTGFRTKTLQLPPELLGRERNECAGSYACRGPLCTTGVMRNQNA